ncbi:hypothetical protein MRX96_012735 [Rhipicephalus microplus]
MAARPSMLRDIGLAACKNTPLETAAWLHCAKTRACPFYLLHRRLALLADGGKEPRRLLRASPFVVCYTLRQKMRSPPLPRRSAWKH